MRLKASHHRDDRTTVTIYFEGLTRNLRPKPEPAPTPEPEPVDDEARS